MNKVYLVITNYNWYCEDYRVKVEAFDSLENAKEYLKIYSDITFEHLKERVIGNLDIEDEDSIEEYNIEDYIDVCKIDDTYISYNVAYVEDDYETIIYIEEKDIMTM